MMKEIKRYLEDKKNIDDIFTLIPALKDTGVFI